MHDSSASVDAYFDALPQDKKDAMQKLRKTLLTNIPKGFAEQMSYGMPGYVVPHSIYPAGYHCNPKLPLPFISIAAQKNFIAIYHMGLFADTTLLTWFAQQYPKYVKSKLDMGKSCIRFKKPDEIPYALIGALLRKMSVKDWINIYEKTRTK
ncbi:MAG: DUF1801 domain-containing protein [Chitinophagales bacterium]